MRKLIIALFIVGVSVCAVLLFYKTRNQVRKAKTYDTLSVVLLTARNTLYATNWTNGYDIVNETKKRFPGTDVSGSNIMDEWGNGIHVEIKTNGQQFGIRIVSAGPDGLFGTPDDLIKTDEFDQTK